MQHLKRIVEKIYKTFSFLNYMKQMDEIKHKTTTQKKKAKRTVNGKRFFGILSKTTALNQVKMASKSVSCRD